LALNQWISLSHFILRLWASLFCTGGVILLIFFLVINIELFGRAT
jgi:hypothetical protein